MLGTSTLVLIHGGGSTCGRIAARLTKVLAPAFRFQSDVAPAAAKLRELRGLERMRGTAGRDRVDHRRSAHAHDDAANSAAIALVRAAESLRQDGLLSYMKQELAAAQKMQGTE